MRKAIGVLCLAALLLLPGCAREITSGRIVSKEFIAEHDETHSTTTTIFVGKTMIPIIHVHSIHYPDRWYIRISNTENGHVRTRDLILEHEEWDGVHVGDDYQVRPDQ